MQHSFVSQEAAGADAEKFGHLDAPGADAAEDEGSDVPVDEAPADKPPGEGADEDALVVEIIIDETSCVYHVGVVLRCT